MSAAGWPPKGTSGPSVANQSGLPARRPPVRNLLAIHLELLATPPRAGMHASLRPKQQAKASSGHGGAQAVVPAVSHHHPALRSVPGGSGAFPL